MSGVDVERVVARLERIERRQVSLEGAVRRAGEEAALAREHAASAEKALDERLGAIELWRARLEGAFYSARLLWAAAGAGGGGLATLLIGRAL